MYFPPCIWNAECVYMESCYLQIHALWFQSGGGGVFNYCPIVPMYYMSEVFLKINRENYFMEDMK